MAKYYIEFEADTFGITNKSLRMLRNTLCKTYNEQTAIVYVATGGITGGFLIVVPNQSRAYWTGDGFRHDNGGEGGRGYRAACKLIESFGLDIQDDVGNYIALLSTAIEEEALRTVLKDIVLAIESDLTFIEVSQLIPHY